MLVRVEITPVFLLCSTILRDAKSKLKKKVLSVFIRCLEFGFVSEYRSDKTTSVKRLPQRKPQ